jgi:hydroxypyruvate isomerase
MPRFCANLSMLFTELPFLDRFEAAAKAGFAGVEYLFPYEYEPDEILDRLKANGLTQVLFNMPAGDWAAGERGLAALPDRAGEFREGVAKAARYAGALGTSSVHCMAGILPPGIDAASARHTYVENLRFAAEAFSDLSANVLIEPINTRDMPGYFLTHTRQAMDVIAEVGAGNVRLQYDCYHMQIMEGDLTPTIERLLPSIAHIQIADTPGRNEPGTGEINYPFIFAHLDRIGYAGWIGCEYRPRGTTADGLGWLAAATATR